MAIEIRTNTPKQIKTPKNEDGESIRTVNITEAIDGLGVWWQRLGHSSEKTAVEVLQKHQERLAYNAAYQRDLRTIKRLGLSVTVKQYRESLK